MRGQREVESGRLEDGTIEVRIVNLEKRLNMIQTLIIKEKEKKNDAILCLEN